VPINCGAIVDTLFESELFGHKKGSFTGATMDKDGLFKVADNGTLFLDEVSEIPLSSQVKLLRAIEQKEITPVGTTDLVNVNVRIIAASNKDLRKEVEEGKFREDLFFRLNVIEINLPPLSDRREDVALLASYFLDMYKNEMGRNIQGFTNEAMNAILKYKWKGEVRELENVIERAVIFCDESFITLDHLPEYMWPAGELESGPNLAGEHSLKQAVRNFERQYILQVMAQHGGNKDEVAKELGVSLSSLYRKIEEYGQPQKSEE
ncbi:MAG: sigma-54-dependent Fis family transcriptional regulator, partial [Ignavibacteriales bacterium]|nr:sigma-54-dependent Fis family transcriptional regulator [Ignavibacteriales bacterium]